MNLKALTHSTLAKRALVPLVLLAVFFGGWYLGLPAKPSSAKADDTVWTCSMHPQIRQPQSGQCPLCQMDLIQLETGSESGLREVRVSPEAAALMDLRVSPVLRKPATVDVRLFGKIAYDERNVTTTTARIGGRLDRFYVDFTGARVRKGDHIAEIYSPELFVVQQDLIKAVRGVAAARRSGTAAAVQTQQRLLKSARERLRLLQLTDEQIDAIATQAQPSDHITLYAPQDGVVTKRHVVEGAYVKTGDALFSVAALSSVWLNLEAYESDLPWLHFAQEITFTVEAIPGTEFRGRIANIDPELDNLRRVVRVRVNVANPQRLLKPGMFARAKVQAKVAQDGSVIDPGLAGKWISPMHPEIIEEQPGECPICGMDLVPAEELGFIAKGGGVHGNALLVPASAVMQTGLRAVVYVRLESSPVPLFEGREILVGAQVGEYFVVESGLAEGEMVVTRGAFKLDSELQLKARPSMMNRNAGLVETPAAEAERGLLGQWGVVPRALGRLQEAAANGDGVAVAEALSTIQSAVERVNISAFHPQTTAGWREFSARLKNAVARSRQRTAPEFPIVYRDMRHAIEQAGKYLGLPYEPVRSSAGIAAGSLAGLEESIGAYLALAEALAADDEAKAVAAVPALSAHLGADAATLNEAKDITAIRAAFSPLSALLIDRAREGGIDRLGNLYVVHCPMVKGNKGGDWLSSKPVVINPYFGAEMLDCGVVSENLSFAIEK